MSPVQVSLLLIGLLSTADADYPEPLSISGDVDVHDPSMSHSPDGKTYYLVATGNNIPIRHGSTDKKSWTFVGEAFPGGVPWCHPYSGNSDNVWAPDISFHSRTAEPYALYYSCSTFGSAHSAIFLATSKTGLPGQWTNRGLVIDSNEPATYNAIDPNLIVDQNSDEWWLAFGSFWTGIKMIRLDKNTGLWSCVDKTVYPIASRAPNLRPPNAIEAAYIYYHDNAYYLFVSWDNCCQGLNSNYRVVVGRSDQVTGPYVDRNGVPMEGQGGGTEIVATHGSQVHGPGHEALLHDPVTAEDLFIYHYYYSSNGASRLGMNNLGWDDRKFPYLKSW